MKLETRVAKLEGQWPAIDPEKGFFVVGSAEQADTLREQFANAGQPEPACIVTGIERERPLWLPAHDDHGRVEGLKRLSDDELDAVIDIVRTAIAAHDLMARQDERDDG